MSGPYFADESVTLYLGDALDVLRQLSDQSVDCCVTSPPYFGLRDYGIDGQYGLEASPAEYVATMRQLFGEVRRVLATDGTLWLNIGDSYASDTKWGGSTGGKHVGALHGDTAVGRGKRTTGLPNKNLIGVPWRTAFALQDDGWILRNDNIWAKPNAMPEPVKDRMSSKHEYLFMFAKSERYWFDLEAVKVPTTGRAAGNTVENRQQYGAATGTDSGGRRFGGNPSSTLLDIHDTRNPGDVWTVPTEPFADAHFACMPVVLAERCIQAGCKPGGVVLDPFSGSGTTGLAAGKHGRRYVGIDLNAEYLDLSLRTRLAQAPMISEDIA